MATAPVADNGAFQDASPGMLARQFAPAESIENAKLPQRYVRRRRVVVLLSMIGTMTIYAHRVCMSVAAAITSQTDRDTTMISEHSWSPSEQGLLLAAFYAGYVFWQLPAAWFVRLIGPGRVFGIGMMWSSLFTLLTPWASDVSFYLALLCRLLVGFGQGPEYPAASVLVASWAPPLERAQMISTICSGAYFGTFVTFPLSGFLLSRLGWRMLFYVYGGWGVAYFFVYSWFVRDAPRLDPQIHHVELEFIEASQRANVDSTQLHAEQSMLAVLKCALCSRAIWALIVACVCNNFGFYFLLSELPTFLSEILQLSGEISAAFSIAPYLLIWLVTVLSGLLADHMVRSGRLKLVKVRRLCFLIAEMPAACLLVLVGYSSSTWLTLGSVILAIGCNGFFNCAISANVIDVGHMHSGVIYALTNTAGTVPAIVAEPLFGVLTQKYGYLQGFRLSFWVCFVLYTAGTVIFCLASSGQPFIKDQCGRSSSAISIPPSRSSQDVLLDVSSM